MLDYIALGIIVLGLFTFLAAGFKFAISNLREK